VVYITFAFNSFLGGKNSENTNLSKGIMAKEIQILNEQACSLSYGN
jgi:hypothetical protein